MALVYRIAELRDVAATMAIRNAATENKLVSSTIGADAYERAFTAEGHAIVCEADGEVVGFVCGRPDPGDIWALFVRDDHWGRGIGSELMNRIERWMFDHGVSEIWLTTGPGTRAERLYLGRGWQRAGVDGGDVKLVLPRR